MAKILVVDDDPNIRNYLNQLLSSQGHVVVEATSYARALTLFRADTFGIVIVEILLADHDAFALLKDIKQPEHLGARILAITAGSNRLPRDYLLNIATMLGADAVLPKPLDAAKTLATVNKLLPGS